MLRYLAAVVLLFAAVCWSWTSLGVGLPGLCWIICAGLCLTLLVSWASTRPALAAPVKWSRHTKVHALCVLAIVALTVTPTLFLVRFSHAAPELRELAASYRADPALPMPQHAGTFKIVRIGSKDDGSLYLWTDNNPNGPEGFVFDYTGKHYNIWSEKELANDCFFIAID